MKLTNCWRLGLIATVVASCPDALRAGSGFFEGKTLIADFSTTMTACRASSSTCKTGATISAIINVYLSNRGRVFDFASGNKGQSHALGEWFATQNGNRERWRAEKNRLLLDGQFGALTSNLVFEMSDTNQCTIISEPHFADRDVSASNKVQVRSCTVRSGVQER